MTVLTPRNRNHAGSSHVTSFTQPYNKNNRPLVTNIWQTTLGSPQPCAIIIWIGYVFCQSILSSEHRPICQQNLARRHCSPSGCAHPCFRTTVRCSSRQHTSHIHPFGNLVRAPLVLRHRAYASLWTYRFGPNESGNVNFRTVPKALILLFRITLGQG
jgi:hypothetical protein